MTRGSPPLSHIGDDEPNIPGADHNGKTFGAGLLLVSNSVTVVESNKIVPDTASDHGVKITHRIILSLKGIAIIEATVSFEAVFK